MFQKNLEDGSTVISEERVLKLKKQDNTTKAFHNADDELKELENQIKILENVLKPILGESFINIPTIVFLKKEELKIVIEVINKFRPDHRKHKSVKVEGTYVYMLPDYCSLPQCLKSLPTDGPVICIEVKPKQGFTKDEKLSKTCDEPLPLCRFCMMQKYKLDKGLVSTKSGYCPTDLYSGCYSRMLHAVRMLFETPQNNLRIFKDQKLIYSEEKKGNLNEILSNFIPLGTTRSTDVLCDLIVKALVKPLPFGMNKTPFSSARKFSQNCINAHQVDIKNGVCQLPPYCVLERILSGQLLDDLPIVDLDQLYQQIKDKTKFSDYIGCYSRSEIPPFVGKLTKAPDESEYEYASRKVWEFLIALLMKDCSIMLTLQHLIPKSSSEIHTQNIMDKLGNSYVFSIAIADLDAKPLNRVEKVFNDLSVILESYCN